MPMTVHHFSGKHVGRGLRGLSGALPEAPLRTRGGGQRGLVQPGRAREAEAASGQGDARQEQEGEF